MRALPLLSAAALALTAGACAVPSAEKSTADGAASRSAEKGEKGRTGQPWWKLSQYSRKADFKPWVHGDVRPGPGLLSKDGDGFVLYRQGEAVSSDPTKPSKVRR